MSNWLKLGRLGKAMLRISHKRGQESLRVTILKLRLHARTRIAIHSGRVGGGETTDDEERFWRLSE